MGPQAVAARAVHVKRCADVGCNGRAGVFAGRSPGSMGAVCGRSRGSGAMKQRDGEGEGCRIHRSAGWQAVMAHQRDGMMAPVPKIPLRRPISVAKRRLGPMCARLSATSGAVQAAGETHPSPLVAHPQLQLPVVNMHAMEKSLPPAAAPFTAQQANVKTPLLNAG
jgi:hypothetical protein